MLQLKKQNFLKAIKTSYYINNYQCLENIAWVALITQGKFAQFPENFVYVDFSSNSYTASLISETYPNAKVYTNQKPLVSTSNKIQNIMNIEEVSEPIHLVYIDNISFISREDWFQMREALIKKVIPGGYIVLGHENKIGWEGFQVVADLIRGELMSLGRDRVTHQDLDNIFTYFNQLALKKISVFGDGSELKRFLTYLKTLSEVELSDLFLKKAPVTYTTSNVFQSDSGLHYVGSLPIVNNYIHLGLDGAQKDFVGSVSSSGLNAVERKDMISLPFFKTDIWQKNRSEVNTSFLDINKVYFGVYSTLESFPHSLKVKNFTFDFKGSLNTALRGLLNEKGFLTLSEILANLKNVNEPEQVIVNQVMVLIAAGQIKVSLHPSKYKALNRDQLLKNYKLKFKDVTNQNMFSDVYKFFHQQGVLVDKSTRLLIPFDSPMCMIMTGLTKVSSNLVAQYCAETWCEKYSEKIDISKVIAEFRSKLLKFEKHYLVKFLELNIADQVLV